eukprot:4379612-Amphidinium_carterae.1
MHTTSCQGEELKYCGVPISDVFAKNMGVGGVICLLWFRRQLPPHCAKFIEMVLMVTADHGQLSDPGPAKITSAPTCSENQ